METQDKVNVLREVLRLELESLQMLRRRAKDNALRAMVIAEREVILEREIAKLSEGEAA